MARGARRGDGCTGFVAVDQCGEVGEVVSGDPVMRRLDHKAAGATRAEDIEQLSGIRCLNPSLLCDESFPGVAAVGGPVTHQGGTNFGGWVLCTSGGDGEDCSNKQATRFHGSTVAAGEWYGKRRLASPKMQPRVSRMTRMEEGLAGVLTRREEMAARRHRRLRAASLHSVASRRQHCGWCGKCGDCTLKRCSQANRRSMRESPSRWSMAGRSVGGLCGCDRLGHGCLRHGGEARVW